MLYGFKENKSIEPISDGVITLTVEVDVHEGENDREEIILLNTMIKDNISKNDYEVVSIVCEGKTVSPTSNRIFVENYFWTGEGQNESISIGYYKKFIFTNDTIVFRISFRKKQEG